ncbi:MAG: hypothetical protein HYZ84_03625 [Candidatus Omnitrophica bacterium]|nr:hypothetical protein [Candidatus Omnitrophota bacterium]
MLISQKNFLILFSAFLIFLALRLPQTFHYQNSYDDFRNLELAHKIASDPWAGWQPEPQDQRRHPFFYYFLFLEQKAFGESFPYYFAINFLIHFFNALLVARIAKFLGAKDQASLIAGLLFLCTNAFYGVLIKATDTMQLTALLFFLLAVSSWFDLIRGNARAWWKVILFQTLSLLNYEVALFFPVLAAFLVWVQKPKTENPSKIFLRFILPLFIFDLLLVLFLMQDFGAAHTFHEKISLGTAGFMIPKTLSLIRMLIIPLLTWDKGLLPGSFLNQDWVRLAPAVLFSGVFAVLLMRGKGKKSFSKLIPHSIVYACAGWIAIMILPHMLHPLPFQHATRYLLFPMAGFSILFGVFAGALFEIIQNRYAKIGSLFCVLFMVYILGLNLLGSAYQYRRYQEYFQEHPKEDFSAQVHQLTNRTITEKIKPHA